MRSVEAALALDFARRGTPFFLVTLAAMIALPMWIFMLLGTAQHTREGIGLHFTLTLVMGFGAMVAVYQALGRLPRLYSRPITATRLVACQMGLGMLTIAALYALSAQALRLAGIDWPILGPALFLAAAMACALAVTWSLEGSVPAQLLGCIAISLPLVVWFSRCYGAITFGDWGIMWDNPTALEILTLAGIALAAYGFAIRGVAQVRRGEIWNFAWVQAWWERQLSQRSAPARYASPAAAQFTFEWHKLRFAPPVLALCLGLISLTSVFGLVEVKEMLQFVIMMPLMALILIVPLVFGLVLGNFGLNKSGGTMSPFLGALPATDSALAWAMLRNCAATLFAIWGAQLAGTLLIVGATWLAGYRQEVLNLLPKGEDGLKILAVGMLYLVVSWSVATFMTALVATGRTWLIAAVMTGIFGWVICFMWNNQLAYSAPEVIQLWLLVTGGVYLAITVGAFSLATMRRLISARTVLIAIFAWLAFSALMMYLVWPNGTGGFAGAWHFCSFFSLGVLPFASLPLAVHWNRHR